MVKKIQYPFLCLASLLFFTAADKGPVVNRVQTVVIDAGHGGKDPGCRGSHYQEKDVSLAVSLKLGQYIEQNLKDVKVIYTRTSDVFVELEDRAQVANRAKADLFISVHCNAAAKPVTVKDARTGLIRTKMYRNRKGKLVPVETVNPLPFGSETYVMGLKNEEGKMRVATRENSAIFYEDDYEKKYGGFDPESEESYIIMSNYTSAFVLQSASLAVKIQEEYAKKAGRENKGVHRQSIWVLWRTSMPSLLTELGYLTNPQEEKFLGSSKGQEYLAKSLFVAFRKYKDDMENVKRDYADEFETLTPPAIGDTLAKEEPPRQQAESTDKAEPVVKTPVSDSKYAELKIQGGKSDSSSAEKIVSAFKDKKTAPVLPKDEIRFRVQFASSPAQLDLKQAKYSCILKGTCYKSDNLFKYTSGSFASMEEARLHQQKLRSGGFADCFVVAFKNGERIDLSDTKKSSADK
jgi:N-acetylmuramoyl-L-alanine amidase